MRNTYIKALIILVSTFIFFTLLVEHAQASDENETMLSREEWKADDYLVTFDEEYSFPKSIKVVLISKNITSSESLSDIRELYYYYTTRSGFGDFPFHFVVAWDGQVYEANKYGGEAKIQLAGKEDSIFIAFLQDESEQLTISSVSPLKDTILEAMNKYAIPADNVEFKKLSYKFEEQIKLSDTKLEKVSKAWDAEYKRIKKELASDYEPSDIKYEAELVDVVLPEDLLQPTSKAEIKIKVKNTGKVNFYSSPSSNIYIARDKPLDERSLFHISEEWDSLSRISLLKEGEWLVSDEEMDLSFNVYVPLYPPEISEDFVLLDPAGNVIEGTEFTITLKVKDIDADIIEITDTPVGYLNVRRTPGFGEVITKVGPGERFIVKEYQDGYYKIEANGKIGWIVQTYVKVVK